MNDNELLVLLRAGNPALTSRAPLPDTNRLVEAVLQTDAVILTEITATDSTTRTAKAAARGRRRLFGLAAAAALLLGGGITAGITANSGNGHSTAANAPLSLTLAGDTSKCAAPVPDQLAGNPTLFYGTVTSVKGPLVTLHVDHWLRGGGTDTVLVSSDPDLPEKLTFTVGQHYIVAADKSGTIPTCGANGASEETWKEFRQALGK